MPCRSGRSVGSVADSLFRPHPEQRARASREPKCPQAIVKYDILNTKKGIQRLRAGSGRAKNGYGSAQFHAVIRQQQETEGVTQSSYNSYRAKTPRALCDQTNRKLYFFVYFLLLFAKNDFFCALSALRTFGGYSAVDFF